MLQFKEGKVKQDGGGGVGSLYFSYTGIWLLPKKPYSVKKERKNFTFHVNFWWVKYIKSYLASLGKANIAVHF